MTSSAFTAASLFSGVGGMDLGLQRAGMRHAMFCEIDEWRCDVLAAHWPRVPVERDVRAVTAVPGRVDLLVGGFPCQDLSVAGRRRGLAGARSGLFWEFARVAEAIRPAWLLVENVPGLLSSHDGRDFGVLLGALADLGYGVAWRVLDARYFGTAQRRRRVFVVGRAGGDARSALLAVCEGCDGGPAPQRCSWQAASGVARARAGRNGRRGIVAAGSVSGLEVAAPILNPTGGPRSTDIDGGTWVAYSVTPHSGQGSDLSAVEVDTAPALASTTEGEQTDRGVRLVQGSSVRRLTPVECERLMSWPDGWTAPPGLVAPDTRRYRACGDGVVSNVAEWIGRRMLAVEAQLDPDVSTDLTPRPDRVKWVYSDSTYQKGR